VYFPAGLPSFERNLALNSRSIGGKGLFQYERAHDLVDYTDTSNESQCVYMATGGEHSEMAS